MYRILTNIGQKRLFFSLLRITFETIINRLHKQKNQDECLSPAQEKMSGVEKEDEMKQKLEELILTILINKKLR